MSNQYDDLDRYIAARRISDLAVSPDGSRIVVALTGLDDDRTKYVSSLWELDATGLTQARRLTFGALGESGPVFTAAGDLLFTRTTSEDDKPVVWSLPATGGEASAIVSRTAGLSGVRVPARGSDVFALSNVHGSAASESEDDVIARERKDKKIEAILHTGYPVRFWDHDLGPATPHLFVSDALGSVPRDLTADARGSLREASYDVAPDGSFVVSTWTIPGPLATQRTVLVRIDVATGERTTLVDDPDAELGSPSMSPDGSSVLFLRESASTPESAPRTTLHRLDFESGTVNDIAPQWDRWPTPAAWTADGSAVLVVADEDGRSPIFLIDRAGRPRRLVNSQSPWADSAFTHVQVGADGSVFALAASYAAPPHPVRIDADTGVVTALRTDIESSDLPGTLTEIDTVAADGSRVRAWLAVPTGASTDAPVPLLLWVHGGPLASWNTWSWRWNPWIMVAAGYAVLLPDPALSTGYGQEFVQRGWGAWGQAPYTDLMSITDAAVELPEIDRSRVGAMGGSFGGYMANWIAGHTDRFSAIVTHASLWALDQFGPTTDASYYSIREMTPEMAVENSPHLYVSDIVTPMLVIHGDKDYRVPVGEGLRLWFELLSESGLPADDRGVTDHRFLYFPNENHWVLSPQHAKLWYEVVLSFLSQHVLEVPRELPRLLG